MKQYDHAGTLIWAVIDSRARRDVNGDIAREWGNRYIAGLIVDRFCITNDESNGAFCLNPK